jgi:SLOG cluster2
MPQNRPLEGMAVGISISEAEDLASTGFTPADISLVTVELCRRLVALGAQVVLGHQWRPGGIMEQVTRFAQAYHMESGGSGQPIIHNVMAWPDKASLSEYDREQLQDLVRIYEPQEPLGRAEALTTMRQQITRIANARICLSGKTESYSGSMPGLIEEAFLSINQGQPAYVSAMMGGAAAALIEWIRGRREMNRLMPETTQISGRMPDYFDGNPDRRYLIIAKLCRLYPEELEQLFSAQNLDTIIQLSTRGMSRINGTLRDWEPDHF